MIRPLSHQAFEHSLALDNIVAEAVPPRCDHLSSTREDQFAFSCHSWNAIGEGRRPMGCGLQKATEPQLRPKEDHGAAMRTITE